MRSIREAGDRRRLAWFGWLLILSLSAHAAADWASLRLMSLQPAAVVCPASAAPMGECVAAAEGHVGRLPLAAPVAAALAFLEAPRPSVLKRSSLIFPPLTPPPPAT
jgi:hypothetical protein